ncbi:MAG TPA: signal peptide peptidase SppA [bacterium]|nr:signal peptide peptidase SppA [bacterium]
MKTTPSPTPSTGRSFLYLVLGLGFFFALSLAVLAVCVGKIMGHVGATSGGSDEITLIEIEGPIVDSDDVVGRIKDFRTGPSKALLLRLNSPGGAVAPSQEIYDEVLRARADKKIVVASMSSLAASGAYYIASAADKIVADPGTLTGSIGVIAEFPDVSSLMEKVGVKYQIIKSGKFKDTGSFSRAMTPEEKAYLQGTIDDVFGQFLQSVLEGRRKAFQEKLAQQTGQKPSKITDGQIRDFILQYADGRVLTGKKAYELGFVDQLGNYEDAVDTTAKLAGIKGTPEVFLSAPPRFRQMLDNILPFSFLSRVRLGADLEYRAF